MDFEDFAIDGADKGNYVLEDQPDPVTADITPKEVTITGTAVEPSKDYDGSDSAKITSEGTLNGVLDGDQVTIVKGKAAYADKNVGTGKKVTFSNFALDGADKDNYVLRSQPASVTADIIGQQEVISVDITWDSMDFTYTAPTEGKWNTTEHKYEDPTTGSWSATSGKEPKITVTNYSSVPVKASFAFRSAVEGLNGVFTGLNGGELLVTADNESTAGRPSAQSTFSLSGNGIDKDREVGTIIVTVTAA